jgi:hypothetical protein
MGEHHTIPDSRHIWGGVTWRLLPDDRSRYWDAGTWRPATEGPEHPASATSRKPELHIPTEW